jgi:predicted acetyltransferase
MSDLVTPAVRYRDSFLAGAAEVLAEGRLDSTYSVCLGYNLKALESRFDHFVRDLVDLGRPSWGSNGRYVDRVLWLVDGEEYLGQSSIRPELCTEYLITYGGHIGYSIRPSRRRCGYGRQLLAMTLEAARGMGLKRILVTCDSDNLSSRKVIESNGGIFEQAMKMPPRAFHAEGRRPQAGIEKRRYWIELYPDNGRPP